MSARKNQPAAPRHEAPARSTRRNRRSNAPALTSLEDRRLMTAGFAPITGGGGAPMMATSAAPPAQVFQATSDRMAAPTLSLAGDVAASVPGAPGDATALTMIAPADVPTDTWIYMGSDSQFGPASQVVLYGGASAWPAPQYSTAASSDAGATDPQKALDAAFAKQSADFQTVQDKSEVTPKLIAALRDARSQVASEAGEPDATLLKTFQDDAQAVQQSGTFTDSQQQQLKDEYTAVLKSAGVSDGTISALFAAQDAVKAAGHVTADDIQLLAADQKAVQDLLDAMPKPDWSAVSASGVYDATTLPAYDAAVPISARGGLGGVYMNQSAAPGGTPGSAPQGVVTTLPATIDPAASPGVVTTTSEPVSIDPAASSGVVTTTAVPVSSGSWDPRAAAVGVLPAGASVNGGGKGWSMPSTYAVPTSISTVGGQSNVVRRLSSRAGGRAGGFSVGGRATANVQRVNGVGVRAGGLGMRTAQPAAVQTLAAPVQRLAVNKMVATDA